MFSWTPAALSAAENLPGTPPGTPPRTPPEAPHHHHHFLPHPPAAAAAACTHTHVLIVQSSKLGQYWLHYSSNIDIAYNTQRSTLLHSLLSLHVPGTCAVKVGGKESASCCYRSASGFVLLSQCLRHLLQDESGMPLKMYVTFVIEYGYDLTSTALIVTCSSAS